MLKELERQPNSGFLGSISGGLLIVQYWRSFGHLEAYSRSQDRLHWPAWVAFNKRMGESRGGGGLGRAGSLIPATGRKESARGRVVKDGAGGDPQSPAAGEGYGGKP